MNTETRNKINTKLNELTHLLESDNCDNITILHSPDTKRVFVRFLHKPSNEVFATTHKNFDEAMNYFADVK